MLQALWLKPDYPKVLLRMGRLHRRLGQWDFAIEVKAKGEQSARLPGEEILHSTQKLRSVLCSSLTELASVVSTFAWCLL